MRKWLRAIGLLVLLLVAVIVACWWLWPRPKPIDLGPDIQSGFEETSHPISFPEILQLAKKAQEKFGSEIHDYSAVMKKRERIGDKMPDEPTFMFMKIREKPFSVYLHFLAPASKTGNEALYREDRDDGKVLGHTTGWLGKSVGTVYLAPTGLLAMNNELYPITRIGLRQLCSQLIEIAGKVPDPSKVNVDQFDRAKVNDRACTLYRLFIPVTERGVRAYLVRIFVDKEIGVPIRLELYKMLTDLKADPQLFQEYTYLNLKINRGYSDADFDKKNPQYKFP